MTSEQWREGWEKAFQASQSFQKQNAARLHKAYKEKGVRRNAKGELVRAPATRPLAAAAPEPLLSEGQAEEVLRRAVHLHAEASRPAEASRALTPRELEEIAAELEIPPEFVRRAIQEVRREGQQEAPGQGRRETWLRPVLFGMADGMLGTAQLGGGLATLGTAGVAAYHALLLIAGVFWGMESISPDFSLLTTLALGGAVAGGVGGVAGEARRRLKRWGVREKEEDKKKRLLEEQKALREKLRADMEAKACQKAAGTRG